ncbi:MAG: folylpolyglutamate synthase/dihydrofolate synthase family protein [Mycobacterium sp.]
MTDSDFPYDGDFPSDEFEGGEFGDGFDDPAAITPEAIVEPSPDEVAALLQVEHLLDQRWPETKIEPSTARISALMELLGSPQRSYPSIHIAGTNGKTSVARMVDALITALHQRTGRTTSPHLQSATERISIDNKPISPARYVETYREIEPFVELIDQQSHAAGGPAMSKFEVVTAMAFAAFADAPVDVAVVEVGLGGRWDATNIVDAPVAVITPIGVDHVEFLGSDIAGIAGEKAGILGKREHEGVIPEGTDPSMVAVIAQQVPEAMEVILAQAVAADASVAREGSEFAVVSRQVAIGGQLLELQGLGGRYSEVFLPLHGEHQAHNAVVALAAVEAFFGAGASRQLDIDAVRAGFATVASPGRLERMRNAPTVFIDAAHNPAGAAALAQTLAEEFDFRFLVGVLAVMADKDVAGILEALEPVFDHVVVTHNGSPRALEVDVLAMMAEERFGPDRVITAPTLADALETATALVEEAGADGGVSGNGIVITGSVVTAGAARTLFGKDPQ